MFLTGLAPKQLAHHTGGVEWEGRPKSVRNEISEAGSGAVLDTSFASMMPSEGLSSLPPTVLDVTAPLGSHRLPGFDFSFGSVAYPRM